MFKMMFKKKKADETRRGGFDCCSYTGLTDDQIKIIDGVNSNLSDIMDQLIELNAGVASIAKERDEAVHQLASCAEMLKKLAEKNGMS
jgi:hypothetical protein